MTIASNVDEVAWDLEPLLPVAGHRGVDQLLDEADALATRVEEWRGRLAGLDAPEFLAMQRIL